MEEKEQKAICHACKWFDLFRGLMVCTLEDRLTRWDSSGCKLWEPIEDDHA